jgi:hypothetical protein
MDNSAGIIVLFILIGLVMFYIKIGTIIEHLENILHREEQILHLINSIEKKVANLKNTEQSPNSKNE